MACRWFLHQLKLKTLPYNLNSATLNPQQNKKLWKCFPVNGLNKHCILYLSVYTWYNCSTFKCIKLYFIKISYKGIYKKYKKVLNTVAYISTRLLIHNFSQILRNWLCLTVTHYQNKKLYIIFIFYYFFQILLQITHIQHAHWHSFIQSNLTYM